MSVTVEKIEDVLNNRGKQLPLVEGQFKIWHELGENIKDFEDSLKDLTNYKNAPAEIKDIFEKHKRQNLREKINHSLYELEKVKNRIKRSTINIGVSGQARVGKSTLLQTISGLTDEQIPTGSGGAGDSGEKPDFSFPFIPKSHHLFS